MDLKLILAQITFDRFFAVLGFIITIWQLYKTKSAAVAAKQAANDAVSVVQGLEAVTRMLEISSRSRQLLQLLRDKTLDSAQVSSLELCETIAKFRRDSHVRLTIDPLAWQQAVQDATDVYNKIVNITVVKRFTVDQRQELIIEVTRLHTYFTGLAAQA